MERSERADGKGWVMLIRIAGGRLIRCTFVYLRGWGRLGRGEIVDLGGLWEGVFPFGGCRKGLNGRGGRKSGDKLRFRWGKR